MKKILLTMCLLTGVACAQRVIRSTQPLMDTVHALIFYHHIEQIPGDKKDYILSTRTDTFSRTDGYLLLEVIDTTWGPGASTVTRLDTVYQIEGYLIVDLGAYNRSSTTPLLQQLVDAQSDFHVLLSDRKTEVLFGSDNPDPNIRNTLVGTFSFEELYRSKKAQIRVIKN